jgi:hypothetical protein
MQKAHCDTGSKYIYRCYQGRQDVWYVKANSHMSCRSHAMPCHAALIHTCNAAPPPFSDSAVSFVKVRVITVNIRNASRTVKRIGMLLVTTFVELRVVAWKRRTRAGRSHIVSGRQMLIHTCHAMPCQCRAVALRSRFQNGMVVAWNGRGMACVNQTRPHCVYQMGKTQSKPLAAGNWRGTAWYV